MFLILYKLGIDTLEHVGLVAMMEFLAPLLIIKASKIVMNVKKNVVYKKSVLHLNLNQVKTKFLPAMMVYKKVTQLITDAIFLLEVDLIFTLKVLQISQGEKFASKEFS